MSARAATVPPHVAIIMDGNGRWAKNRGLPRIEGHRRGVETVRTTTFAARDLGVRMLTLYAFSIENWKRPQEEVGTLMGLLEYYLKKELSTFVRERVRLRTIGRTHELPAGVQEVLHTTIEETKRFTVFNHRLLHRLFNLLFALFGQSLPNETLELAGVNDITAAYFLGL